VAAYDFYRAVLEDKPYPVRALVAFGSNMLLANGDTLTGRAALERLPFFAQIELVHTPTSRFADVLLPAASWLESAALKVGYVYPNEAKPHVQLRTPAVEPLHQRRSDVDIIFDLAGRLGLGHLGQGQVVMGDVPLGVDAAVEAHLGPLPVGSGLQLGHAAEAQDLRPESVRDLEVPHVEDQVVDAARGLGPGRRVAGRHGSLHGG
jgi:anaerobic selenocysteine-containing dehydrogenase